MQRRNFIFALLATILFICFISFLETKKANASLGLIPSENDWILDQWVIAEAYNISSSQDVTENYSAEVWQFLNSNGFVEFHGRLIANTGEWVLKNGVITIRKDGSQCKDSYEVEKKGRNEIILRGKKMRIHLLKLSNI